MILYGTYHREHATINEYTAGHPEERLTTRGRIRLIQKSINQKRTSG
jgi:hypothetical protein